MPSDGRRRACACGGGAAEAADAGGRRRLTGRHRRQRRGPLRGDRAHGPASRWRASPKRSGVPTSSWSCCPMSWCGTCMRRTNRVWLAPLRSSSRHQGAATPGAGPRHTGVGRRHGGRHRCGAGDAGRADTCGRTGGGAAPAARRSRYAGAAVPEPVAFTVSRRWSNWRTGASWRSAATRAERCTGLLLEHLADEATPPRYQPTAKPASARKGGRRESGDECKA